MEINEWDMPDLIRCYTNLCDDEKLKGVDAKRYRGEVEEGGEVVEGVTAYVEVSPGIDSSDSIGSIDIVGDVLVGSSSLEAEFCAEGLVVEPYLQKSKEKMMKRECMLDLSVVLGAEERYRVKPVWVLVISRGIDFLSCVHTH